MMACQYAVDLRRGETYTPLVPGGGEEEEVAVEVLEVMAVSQASVEVAIVVGGACGAILEGCCYWADRAGALLARVSYVSRRWKGKNEVWSEHR